MAVGNIPKKYLTEVVSRIVKPTMGGSYIRNVDYQMAFKDNYVFVDKLAEKLTTAKLIDYIKTSYNGDVMSTIPMCICGKSSGNDLEYEHCPDCGTAIVKSTERTIESDVWIRPPSGVERLIRTSSLTMMRQIYHNKKLDIIPWLINRNAVTPRTALPIQRVLKERGIERGLNFFYRNFDYILDTLNELGLYKTSINKQRIYQFRQWCRENKDTIFTDRLPIPSKIAFITESTALGVYHDATMKPALDAIVAVANVEEGMSVTTKENRTGKVLELLSDFYVAYNKTHANPKEGWYRQCIYGTLLDFSGRAVITSRTNCGFDVIKTPWGLSLVLLRMHITNKLKKRYPTMTSSEIKEYIYSKLYCFDQQLSDIMNELIAETPHEKGIPVLMLRNPSLRRTSIQQMFIDEINTDPEVKTIELPLDATKGPNADFDGDQMMMALVQDMAEFEHLQFLSSMYDVWDLQSIESIDGVNDIHSPTISTITNALYNHREITFYDKHQRMPTVVDLHGSKYAAFLEDDE